MTDHELLSAYLDGELSAEQARKVEKRLGADMQFNRDHLRLQQVSAIVHVLCEPDPGFIVRHRERRKDLSPIPRWTWRELGYRLAAVAAALLFASGLSVWQSERPGAETLADAISAVEGLDLVTLEGKVLALPESETLAEIDLAEEPVLIIVLGGSAQSGER